MKRYLVRAGKLPFTPSNAVITLANQLTMTNVGNLLFQHAFIKHIFNSNTSIAAIKDHTLFQVPNIDEVNTIFDGLYLPFANAFRNSFKESLSRWSVLLDKIHIPVVVVGIGAQCSSDNPMKELEPINNSVTLFCKKILEHSTSIGVRGAFTAEYLNSLGIKDVDIIGCPSMFYWGKDLPEPAFERLSRSPLRVALNLSPQSPQNVISPNGEIAHKLGAFIEFLNKQPGLFWDYIAQDTEELSDFIWSRSAVTLASITGYKPARTLYPIDSHTWIRELKQYDFSVGTRLHGNIAAILAGIPALLLTHDSRTRELADFFNIASVDITTNARIFDFDYLQEIVKTNQLAKDFPTKFRNYLNFLKKNGIRHNYNPATLELRNDGFFEKVRDRAQFPDISRSGVENYNLLNDKLNYMYALMHQGQ